MKRFAAKLLVLLVAVPALDSFSSIAVACWYCDRSPHNWGFCKTGAMRGHGDCQTVVIDTFNGTTDCKIEEWGSCGAGLGDGSGCGVEGTCDPYYLASAPCTWTDRDVASLV